MSKKSKASRVTSTMPRTWRGAAAALDISLEPVLPCSECECATAHVFVRAVPGKIKTGRSKESMEGPKFHEVAFLEYRCWSCDEIRRWGYIDLEQHHEDIKELSDDPNYGHLMGKFTAVSRIH